jgi:hypothetical protein
MGAPMRPPAVDRAGAADDAIDEIDAATSSTACLPSQARLILGAIVEARADALLAELVGNPEAQEALCLIVDRLDPVPDRIAAEVEAPERQQLRNLEAPS